MLSFLFSLSSLLFFDYRLCVAYLKGHVRFCSLARSAFRRCNEVFNLANATGPMASHTSTVKSVVVVVFDHVGDRRQPIHDFLHDGVEVALHHLSHVRHVLLIADELSADNQLALQVVLYLIEPVFLHFLVEALQRSFEVALDEVEESLLLGAFQEEPNGVGETQ